MSDWSEAIDTALKMDSHYCRLISERDAWKQKADTLAKLLSRNYVRMMLINQECVHDKLRDCPNHKLMEETEAALEEYGEGK